ncbi:hypothetical protein Tco_0827949 [Tanacetum coccineum]
MVFRTFGSGLSAWAQGWSSRAYVLFQGLIQPGPGVLTGAAASVSLSVHSESDVDEDSWITFSDVSSSGVEEGSVVES